MAGNGYADRVSRFAQALGAEGLDAFLAWDPITMGYLQGFPEFAHERFLTLAFKASGEVRLICPAISATQATRVGVKDIRSWKDGEDPLALFGELLDDWNLRTGILAVDDEMPARELLEIQAVAPAALFKPGQEVLSTLMRRKELREIELMRQSGRIADEAFEAVKPQLRAGMTEKHIEKLLEAEMSTRGGEPTFCIVAAGPNAAEPHHLSDDTKVRSGDVLILDFGCNIEGYQSDITRTVSIGKAPEKAHQIYEIVYEAHQAGRAAIRAGVTCGSIDAATRKVIEKAGYGNFFTHRTGHGIGMRGHEEPYIIDGNEFELEPTNCFSIEPGIYIPGEFGVRIENIVAATETGHDSLNANPSPKLIEV